MAFEYPDPARDVVASLKAYNTLSDGFSAATNMISLSDQYHSNEMAMKDIEIGKLKKRNRTCVGGGLVMLVLAILI